MSIPPFVICCWCFLLAKFCLTPWDTHGLHRLLCPWDFPARNAGVDCHFLLQVFVPTHGLNPSLLHLLALASRFFLPLSHLGSPKELRNVLKVELGEYEEGVLQAKKKLGFVHEDSWFTLELSVGIETIRGFSGYCSTDCKYLKDPNRKANGSSDFKERRNIIVFSFLFYNFIFKIILLIYWKKIDVI